MQDRIDFQLVSVLIAAIGQTRNATVSLLGRLLRVKILAVIHCCVCGKSSVALDFAWKPSKNYQFRELSGVLVRFLRRFPREIYWQLPSLRFHAETKIRWNCSGNTVLLPRLGFYRHAIFCHIVKDSRLWILPAMTATIIAFMDCNIPNCQEHKKVSNVSSVVPSMTELKFLTTFTWTGCVSRNFCRHEWWR